MAEELYRQAVRLALSTGEELELVKMLLENMDDAQRRSVINFAGFLARRKTIKWQVGPEDFVIATLPDGIIRDAVMSANCKRVYRALGSQSPWARKNARNSAYYIMMQEAEYRGIKTQWWDDGDKERLRRRLFNPCIDSRHNFQAVADGVICLNCQQKVTDEEVNSAMPGSIRLL